MASRLVAGYAAPAIGLLVPLAALGWLAPRPGLWATKACLVIAAATLVGMLWSRTQRTNRLLARFLEALRHGDIAQSFRAHGRGAGFDELGAALDDALQRLRAERHAAAAENRFAGALVDEAPTPILAIDPGGAVHLANKAARRLFRESDGRETAAFAVYGETFADALATVAPGRGEVCRVLWNGLSQRSVLTASTMDRQGAPWRIVSVQIIQGELEAAELATQADLVRVLTHEIMNSLTPVTSLAASAREMIAEADDGGAGIADARLAIDALARRAAAITHFVDSFRAFGEPPPVTIERFSAREWLDEIVRSFRATPQADGVTLTSEVLPATLAIDGDAVLLGQVMLNLLKNAGEAGAAGEEPPRVAVDISQDEARRIAIRVSDNGAGVPDRLAEEIFLPFFTTKATGTGVGLAFARQVVQRHGGLIGLDRTGAAGATFTILI